MKNTLKVTFYRTLLWFPFLSKHKFSHPTVADSLFLVYLDSHTTIALQKLQVVRTVKIAKHRDQITIASPVFYLSCTFLK